LRRFGFTGTELDDWSWPKFWQRFHLAEEAAMQEALMWHTAILDPKLVQGHLQRTQAVLRGEAVDDPDEWRPMTSGRLLKLMEQAGQTE
jgi:hypothetical protein